MEKAVRYDCLFSVHIKIGSTIAKIKERVFPFTLFCFSGNLNDIVPELFR